MNNNRKILQNTNKTQSEANMQIKQLNERIQWNQEKY